MPLGKSRRRAAKELDVGVLEAKEDRGKAEIEADTSREVRTAVSGKYLAQALKACGGMMELKVKDPSAPMMFCVDGHRLLVMPMATKDTVKATKEVEQAKGEGTSEAEAKPKRRGKAEAEAVAETEADEVKEPVAVA